MKAVNPSSKNNKLHAQKLTILGQSMCNVLEKIDKKLNVLKVHNQIVSDEKDKKEDSVKILTTYRDYLRVQLNEISTILHLIQESGSSVNNISKPNWTSFKSKAESHLSEFKKTTSSLAISKLHAYDKGFDLEEDSPRGLTNAMEIVKTSVNNLGTLKKSISNEDIVKPGVKPGVKPRVTPHKLLNFFKEDSALSRSEISISQSEQTLSAVTSS